MEFILFVFGVSAGSFLKVIADRYEEHLFLWDAKIIGGRSRCPLCNAELRWFELIPVISFFQPFGDIQGSFLRHYALLSGWRQNILLNHLFALFVAGAFFAVLILVTRGRAMGGGDLKLAAALGFVFGWPDIILITVLSFVLGSFIGIGAIMLNKKKMKSYLAFGPFLGAASLPVFFLFSIIAPMP